MSFTLKGIVSLFSVFIITVSFSPQAHSQPQEYPTWEFHMLEYGQAVCSLFTDSRVDYETKLRVFDYDALWVFYQIYNYTGNNYWLECAKSARNFYREDYLSNNINQLSYDRLFVHGLLQDYQFYQSNKTENALQTLLKRANQLVHREPIARIEFSREVAQALMVMVTLRNTPEHSQRKQDDLLNAALFHVNLWTDQNRSVELTPYLAGITAEALIFYDQNIADARILSAIKKLAHTLWSQAWISNVKSFYYKDSNQEPAPDLNLLISPLYSWLAYKTGDNQYREKADQVFSGGVTYAWLASGKHFNQNYRWSFSHIMWDTMVTPTPSQPQNPQPTPTPNIPSSTPVPTASQPNPEPITQPETNRNIPSLSTWENNMLTYGRKNCEYLKSNASFDEKLHANYYDAQWVFSQIYDYTGDSYWSSCASTAQNIYGSQYVIANDGFVPGYWQFTHGLTDAYLRTGNQTARQAVVALAKNAAYARDTTKPYETEHTDFSRETAYAIMSYVNSERVGEPRRARLSKLVGDALDHIDAWAISRSANYVRPFMVGITAHALIMYHEHTGDTQVVTPLKRALDYMWNNLWVASASAFQYTDKNLGSGGTEPAPDLNLLIAPAYEWMYHKTGEQKYRTQADAIFAGGVGNAYLEQGKQFNQNYRWSFEYVKLRSQ